MLVLARELGAGKHQNRGEHPESAERILLPKLESLGSHWRWLLAQPCAWRPQLWGKGRRRSLVSQVWSDMESNDLTPEQMALELAPPLVAIDEIVRYCEASASLIAVEADEEHRQIQDAEVQLAPAA